jgi:hypothetical protein
MRFLLTFAVLAALALPAGSAARERTPNDGTLSVRDGRGVITVAARGAVIGSFAQGRMTIADPLEGDGTGPIVSGEEFHKGIDEKTDFYRGTKVRFRLIGGYFKVRIKGSGINLSAVGKGTLTLDGAGTADDGSFSINGADYAPILNFPLTFPLAAPTP